MGLLRRCRCFCCVVVVVVVIVVVVAAAVVVVVVVPLLLLFLLRLRIARRLFLLRLFSATVSAVDSERVQTPSPHLLSAGTHVVRLQLVGRLAGKFVNWLTDHWLAYHGVRG